MKYIHSLISKVGLSVLAVCFSYVGFAQLSGSYTIDPSGTGARNYTTFTAAQAALQTSGVNGAVVFNVKQGNYLENVQFRGYTGASATNTITFRPDPANTAPVTVQFLSSGTANNFVFRFNGARYIEIDSMILKSLGTSYARQVEFTGTNQYITFDGVEFDGTSGSSQTSTFTANVFDNSGTSQAEYIEFHNCEFKRGSYAVYARGQSSSTTFQQKGWEFNNCDIEFDYYGLYLYYTQTTITDCYIHNSPGTQGYYYPRPIYAYYSNHMNLINNDIECTSRITGSYYAYGAYLNYCRSTSSNRATIANNTISMSGFGGTSYGLYMRYCDYTDAYHNSIRNTQGGAYSVYLLYGNGVTFRNNNVTNEGGTYTMYRIGSQTCTNNNFWGPNGATVTNAGSNATYADPEFTSTHDLHASGIGIHNKGIAITGVMNDIDNDVRCPGTGCPGGASAPDIGADEFYIPPRNASADGFGPLAFCAGSITPQARVKNAGSDTLRSVNVAWWTSTNNGAFAAQTGLSLTGMNLLPGADTIINLGSMTISTGNNYRVRFKTSSPNGGTDTDTTNDEATSASFAPAMSGTYTVGTSTGKDYATIEAGFNDLEANGVCGPVVFNVEEGTYTHQTTITNIAGASATNSITVQPDPNNNNPVTFQFTSTTSSANYVLRLNNTHWITFKDVTFKSLSTSYGRVVDFVGRPSNNTFLNDSLIAPNANTTSNWMAVLYENSGNNDAMVKTTYKKCQILGGSMGAYIYGGNTSSKGPGGNVWDSCNVSDWYYWGFYHYYTDNDTLRNCTVKQRDNANYCCPRGAYFYYCNNSSFVNNTIEANGTSYAYGLYGYRNENSEFRKNDVRIGSNSYGYGLYLYYCYNSPIVGNNIVCDVSTYSYNYSYYCGSTSSSNRNIMANNMISNLGSSGTTYGWYLGYANYTDILHNSIYNKGGSGYAVYLSYGTQVNFRNNNVVSGGNGTALYQLGTITKSTNNAYAPNGTHANNTSGVSWNVDPGFKADDDLHASSAVLHNAGANWTSLVSDDIDGEVRCPGTGCPGNATAPDVGADEYWLPDHDIGATGPGNETVCTGSQLVLAKVSNIGVQAQDTIIYGWAYSTNGGAFTAGTGGTITGAGLGVGKDTNIALGNITFVNGSYYDIWVWATNGRDQRHGNDTITYRMRPAMSGTYTVGPVASDFSKVQDAYDAMNLAGVCGPVVLHLADTTFKESVTVKEIKGTSNVNTVTMMSNPTNANRSVIEGTFTFGDRGNWVTAHNVHLKSSSTVIGFQGDVHHITVDSSFIECTGTGFGSYALYEYQSNTDSLMITNNEIVGGYYCIYLRGNSTARNGREANWFFIGNNIHDWGYMGMYCYYVADGVIRDNQFTEPTNWSYPYSIYMFYNNNMEISSNKFQMGGSSGTYGIYMYYGNYINRLSTDTNRIFNNMFNIRTGTNDFTKYGVRLYYHYNTLFEHNSMYLNTRYSSAYALYTYSMWSGVRIRNNVMENGSSGGRTWYHGSTWSGAQNDYNAFWTNNSTQSGVLGRTLGTNSYITRPRFKDPANLDLRANNLQMDSGALWVNIREDIYDNSRKSVPDIGAHEFDPCYHDGAVTEFAHGYGYIPAGQSVRMVAEITNYGLDSITNVTGRFDMGSNTSSAAPITMYVDEDTLINAVLPVGTTTGNFNAMASVTITESDCDHSNDTNYTAVNVSDSVYSREMQTSTATGIGNPTPLEFGQTFEVFTRDTMTSVSFYLVSPTFGASVRAIIYNLDTNGYPSQRIDSTRTMMVTNTNGNWYTLQVGCNGVDLQPGTYFVSIHQVNPPNMSLGYTQPRRSLERFVYVNLYNGNGWLASNDPGLNSIVDDMSFLLRANFGELPARTVLADSSLICNGTYSYIKPIREYNSQFWSNGLRFDSIKVTTPGTYSVTVWDEIGCLYQDSTVAFLSDPINLTTTPSRANCGMSDGSAMASATGNSGPYTYAWSNGASTASITNVPGDNYRVTVTDQLGCAVEQSVQVLGAYPKVTTSWGYPRCNGDANGTAEVTVTKGVPGYTYSWSGGNTPNQATNSGLAAGTYTVDVTDLSGCKTTETILVVDPAVLTSSSKSQSPSACLRADGNAEVLVQGGIAPYNYFWGAAAGSQTTAKAIGLRKGVYDVTITDSLGCQMTAKAKVVDPNSPIAVPNDMMLDCSYDTTTAMVTINGGTTPMSYTWDYKNSTASSLKGVGAGSYKLHLVDNNGCEHDTTVVITAPAPVMVSFSNITDNGQGNVSATANATGGTPPYVSYLWSPSNEVGPTANRLDNGVNTVTVKDANGCSFTYQIDVFSEYTGINVFGSEDAFNIYPNPTSGEVNVEFNLNTEEAVVVKVMNATGELINVIERDNVVQDKITIDLSGYAVGMYFIETTIGNERINSKIQLSR